MGHEPVGFLGPHAASPKASNQNYLLTSVADEINSPPRSNNFVPCMLLAEDMYLFG